MKKVINIKRENLQLVGAIDDEGRTPVWMAKAGDLVILVSDMYVGPSNCHANNGDEHWSMVDYNSHKDGVAANMDPNCKALEGWRGTTDDWSCHAHGVWRIAEIGESRQWAERPEPRYGFPGERKARVVLEKVTIG